MFRVRYVSRHLDKVSIRASKRTSLGTFPSVLREVRDPANNPRSLCIIGEGIRSRWVGANVRSCSGSVNTRLTTDAVSKGVRENERGN